ncbi:deoxynucleoside triphosphate triphosphohydrolase SAMHD1 protein [Trifolium repens]|nr:deoxynucleoside triphosphate triphosphohydrolase SAMHD1 protein [Trifolium repens]
MGAYCNDTVSFPPRYDVVSSRDKLIHDNVHGNIFIDSLSLKFIDTEQFQRLRELKQLGFTHLVYPGAVHSRFEHSLGVYWIASQCVEKLNCYQGMELGIDKFDIQSVKLAGLMHDVGHGPFSHLFEREFLPQVISGSDWSHEQMSVKMVDYIVEEHHIDIDPGMLKRVKEMILASSEFALPRSSSEKSFLYDIVANGRNGIDVDKFDYIARDCRACGLGCNFEFQRLMETMRVLDDEICYRAKDYLTIHKLFSTRADLYRTVYTHPKVKAIELMVVDALVQANDYLQISSSIQDPAEYWKLDDSIIKTIETSPCPELKEARELILRIRRRNLYQFCNEYAVPRDIMDNFKKVTPHDIVCSQKNGGVMLKEEDVAVSNVKIDLTRGKDNPLESIHFFKDYESDEKFTIPDERISHLLPASCQDMIVRVYSKKPELVEKISEAFENYQLKTYGIKAQVHSTPQKKRRYNSCI